MHRYVLRLIAHLLIWSLLLGYAIPGKGLFAQAMNDYLPGEVVVKLAQVGDLAGVAATYGLDPTPIDQFGTRPIYRLRILDQSTPPLKAAALASDVRVRYAEPNYQGQAPEGQQRTSWAAGGGTGEYAMQWAAATIRLAQAHRVTRGAGTVVAVLDTGIDPTHPQVAGRLRFCRYGCQPKRGRRLRSQHWLRTWHACRRIGGAGGAGCAHYAGTCA